MTKVIPNFSYDEIWKCERHSKVLVKECLNFVCDDDSHLQIISATSLHDVSLDIVITLFKNDNKSLLTKNGKEVMMFNGLINVNPENLYNKFRTMVIFS